MFTGLIEEMGRVVAAERRGQGLRLRIDLGPVAEGVKFGHSINVNGVCQTVAAIEGTVADFDCITETLRRTTLAALSVGERVNIERSLAAGAPMGGHFVTGHIDGTGTVVERRESGREFWLRIRVPPALTAEMVPKGSVAVDGVSLTLVEVTTETFTVTLIPVTLRQTTLGSKDPGDLVNIETDILAKYVRKILSSQFGADSATGITQDLLKQYGFMD